MRQDEQKPLVTTMKALSYSLVVAGLAIAIVSIWVTRVQIRRDIEKSLNSLRLPEPHFTSTTPTARHLRHAAIQSREKVNRALSDLRSIKTQMVVQAEDSRKRAARSLEDAQESLLQLSRLADKMNDVALRVEEDARKLLVDYESALNQAIDEAIAPPKSESKLWLDNVIAAIGACVSVAGLFLSWRSDKTERAKTEQEIAKGGLEIEELRQKLAQVPQGEKA